MGVSGEILVGIAPPSIRSEQYHDLRWADDGVEEGPSKTDVGNGSVVVLLDVLS